MKTSLFLSILAISGLSLASTMTIQCKVEAVSERVDDKSVASITFDYSSDSLLQDLNIGPVYGNKIYVPVTYVLDSKTGKESFAVGQVCVENSDSSVCSNTSSLTLYPGESIGGQPGDSTTISDCTVTIK